MGSEEKDTGKFLVFFLDDLLQLLVRCGCFPHGQVVLAVKPRGHFQNQIGGQDTGDQAEHHCKAKLDIQFLGNEKRTGRGAPRSGVMAPAPPSPMAAKV